MVLPQDRGLERHAAKAPPVPSRFTPQWVGAAWIAAAFVLIIAWAFVQPLTTYSMQAVGDVVFPTILLGAAFISARLARREREYEERRHMAALLADGSSPTA